MVAKHGHVQDVRPCLRQADCHLVPSRTVKGLADKVSLSHFPFPWTETAAHASVVFGKVHTETYCHVVGHPVVRTWGGARANEK